MAILHTVNQSPAMGSALVSCLNFARRGAGVLLMQDAVLAAMAGATSETLVRKALQSQRVFVLEPDWQARGLPAVRRIEGVECVDYSGFVDLCGEYSKVLAWY